jgi:nitrite reductase/ring-hydroxylating ferredoxin subunit
MSKPNTLKECIIDGTAILLVNLNGEYFAISNICPHMRCMLSRGRLQEGHVICGCQGATFDVNSGKHISGPSGQSLKKYELKVEDDKILIDI